MKLQYLFDEHMTPRLKAALLRLDPSIAVASIGDLDMPALGTKDPEILRFVEQHQQILVAQDYAPCLVMRPIIWLYWTP
jgi:hypothetical protein